MAIKVKDALKKRGIKVWIDIEQMGGSTLEAMANAIEKSRIICVGFSQKYKASPNCRMELEYSLQLQKKIIPLKFQNNYTSDGWLGLAIGAKLWYDFSKSENFSSSFESLLKEFERYDQKFQRGKSNGTLISNTNSTDQLVIDNHPQNWSKEKVKEWLVKINPEESLGKVFEKENMDGLALHQLAKIEKNSPEFFYSILKNEFGLEGFGDRLRFAAELCKLFE